MKKLVAPGGSYTVAQYAFNNCVALEDMDKSKITGSIGTYAFAYNYKCNKNIILSSGVTSLGSYAFAYNMAATRFKANGNITTISAYALASNYGILEYDFKANTQVPTLSSTDAFNHINELAKIKVPWDLYLDWIAASNWATYANYIDGGTPATITFTGDNTGNIYVNNEIISGTSTTWVGSSMPYSVHDTTTNTVLPTQTLTGITEGSSQTVNIDLSSKKKITLSTGISGLDVIFIIDGKVYNATEESTDMNNGDYYIYVVGSGVSLSYYVNGGETYTDSSGNISTADQDITIPITLSEATWDTFTRPNLSSNGTLGGDSFAVSSYTSGSNPAYYAVNGSTSNYWIGAIYTLPDGRYSPRYFIYNPRSLKITSLAYTFVTSITYVPAGIEIAGSNDGINYTVLTSSFSTSSLTGTSTITNTEGYRYYRLKITVKSASSTNPNTVRISNIAITATEKVAAS